jgi:MFS family permease
MSAGLDAVGAPTVFTDTLEQRRKSAIRGAFFSEVIDFFDIYLPVVVLVPVLGFFRPEHLSSGLQTALNSLIFITTLLGRPVGAVLFGMIADRIGRRRASIYSMSGFGIVTFLIALLPGYESIGISSFILLVLLRFVDGIFLGGGYTGAVPLAIEYAEKDQRGFVGGLVLAGFPAAYVLINLVAVVMFALFPLNGLHSPYAEIGWRIPFVIGGVLAGGMALYYVFRVSESEIWKTETATEAEKVPLSDLVFGKSGRSLFQVFVMMTGFWLTQNLIAFFLPSVLLPHILHLQKYQLTFTLILSYGLVCFSYVGSGVIGQKIGRRRWFITLGPLIAVFGSGLLYFLDTSKGLSFPVIVVLVCLLSVLVTAPWGMLLAYINERFVTDVRATGFGVGYSLSVIIPSFYAFYLNWLGAVVPPLAASAVLMCLGGIIGTIGAALGPETKDVDF